MRKKSARLAGWLRPDSQLRSFLPRDWGVGPRVRQDEIIGQPEEKVGSGVHLPERLGKGAQGDVLITQIGRGHGGRHVPV